MKQIAVQRFFSNTPPKVIFAVLLSVLAAMLSVTIAELFLSEAYADSNSAGVSYRSNTGTGTTQAPKYREWNAGALAWSGETVLADTGSPVRFAWIDYSPTSAKRVVVTLSDDGTLNAFTCSSSCTTASNWVQQSDFVDLWSTAPSGAQRPFDLEFETTSGDLVLVYDKVSTVAAEDLFYRIMPAGSNQFGTEGSIDNSNTLLSSDTVYSFARLSSKKTASANDLALIALDETNSDAVAWVWNGSTDSWGSEKTITLLASIGTEEVVGIAHETSSGDIIAVAGSSTSMFYCEFTGGAWCVTPVTFGPVAIGTINWVTIKADPVSSSNALFVAETGSSSDLDTQYWSGSAWTDHAEHDAAIDGHASRVVDFGWDNAGSGGVLIWGTTSGSLSYKTFTGTSTFGLQLTFAETGTHPWVQMADYPNPTSGDTVSTMGGALDSTLDIGGIRWDGGILTAPVSTGDGGITADTTVTTYENFKVAWQRSGTAPAWDTTISEGLALTDGQAKNPSKRVSENLGLSDSLQVAVAFLQELNEALALADNRSFNAGRRLDETIGISETKTFSSTRSFSENLSLVDIRTTSTLFSNSLSETLAANNMFSAATTKVLLENTGLSDSSSTFSVFIRSMSENLGASDSPALSPHKSLSESLATLDQFGNDVRKSLIENLETNDVLTGSVDFVQGIAETIALTDLTSLATDYAKSLAESIALVDSITDVFVDIQLALGESLALVISFFTPEVGYQSSLVSEGVGFADTLQFGSQYNLSLNETLASQDSSIPQHNPAPQEDETDTVDEPRRGRGGGRSGGSIPSDEPPTSADTHPGVGRNLEFGLSETIRVQSEQNLTAVDFGRVDIDIHAALQDVSTSYQLIPPAALASIIFEIENNGDSTEHVFVEYWYVNEESGVTKFGSTQEFLSAPNQPVLESVDIILPSAGEYSVIASVKTADDNKIQDTTSIEITVLPIDVYLNALVAIAAESSASTGGYLFWVTRGKRTDKKDGAPL